MIYFDNAATGGVKPYAVQEVVTSVVKYLCANPTRSGHRLAASAGEAVFRCRKLLKDVFGAPSTERVVFTKNCTEALNTAIFGLLRSKDHVVATCAEHNSVIRPLFSLKEKEVETTFVFPEKGAYITQKTLFSYEDIAPHIKRETRLVIVNHASNVTGHLADIREIGEGIKRDFPNVLFMVDAAQSGGHLSIDMARDRVDIVCLAGHKGLGGIMGSGALLFSDRCDILPLTRGGTGGDTFTFSQPDYYPERLESGTLNLPAIVALYEGLLYTDARLPQIADTLEALSGELIDGLSSMDGIRIYSHPNSCGIVSFAINGLSSEEAAEILSEKYAIAVRGGFHCAPLMHRYLETEDQGLVRISLSEHNTKREIASLLAALKEIRENIG